MLASSGNDEDFPLSVNLREEFYRIRECDEQLQIHRTLLMRQIGNWLHNQENYFRQLHPAFHVGATLEVLPGKSLKLDGVEYYTESDRGVVKGFRTDKTGQNSMEIYWPRTQQVSTASMSDFKESFSHVGEATFDVAQKFALVDQPADGTPYSSEQKNPLSPRSQDVNIQLVDAAGALKTTHVEDDEANNADRGFQDPPVLPEIQPEDDEGFMPRMSTEEEEKKRRELAEYMASDEPDEEDVIVGNSKLGEMRLKAHRFINHAVTELFISFIILMNSIIVGQEVDWTVNNPGEETPSIYIVLGHFFNFIFLLEVSFRLFAGGINFFIGHQRYWNWFDILLVGSSIMELVLHWIIGFDSSNISSMRVVRLVRIGRILRLVRVARIMRLLLALRLLIVQIASTLKACFWALVLLILIIYIFAMIFAQVSSEYLVHNADGNGALRKYWGSVPRAMYTLYKTVTGGVDWELVADEIAKVHWFWVGVFNVYLAFTVFAVLNVVVGVFCQAAVESAQHDYENMINVKLREKNAFIAKVHRLFHDIDESGDGSITFQELKAHLEYSHVKAYFEHLGLDPEDAWDLFKIIDTDESHEITMEEFTAGCIRLKGSAKVIDIEKVAYSQKIMFRRLNEFMTSSETSLSKIGSGVKRAERASNAKKPVLSASRSGSGLFAPSSDSGATAASSERVSLPGGEKSRIQVFI